MGIDRAYWNSIEGLFRTEEVLKLLLYYSLGIFSYDCVNTAAFDWSIISGQRARKWPHILYIGVKILFMCYITIYIMFFWFTNEVNCKAYLVTMEILAAIVTVSCSALLACRAVCLYSGTEKMIVCTVLVVFGSGVAAVWLYGIADIDMVWESLFSTLISSGICAPVTYRSTLYRE
jgi:hypothetical protein